MTENRPETNEDLANLSQVEQEKCYHVMYAFWHVFHPDYPENHPLREAWWAEVENLRKILTKIPARPKPCI